MTINATAVEKVRTYYQDIAVKNYPFVGHPLTQAEPYVKELYITMLCMTAQYENELSREQQAFIQRLITGMEMDKPITEFIRRSLTVDEEFAQEFYNEITVGDYAQFFTVDILVLIHATASANTKQVELVSEIVDGLTIKEPIFKGLLELVAVILKHTVSAKLTISDEVKVPDFIYYFNTFEGALEIETSSTQYLVNADFKTVANVKPKIPRLFVLSSNLESLIEPLYMSGFKQIYFNDCHFNHIEASITFVAIELILFENCTITNCATQFILNDKSCKLSVLGCQFKDCAYTSSRNALGGIISNYYGNNNEFDLVIENSTFLNCLIKTTETNSDKGAWGAIFSGHTKSIRVANNTFTNCNSYSNHPTKNLFDVHSNSIKVFESNDLVNCNSLLAYISPPFSSSDEW